MGAGGGMVGSSQRDARSSSLQRMVERSRWRGGDSVRAAEREVAKAHL